MPKNFFKAISRPLQQEKIRISRPIPVRFFGSGLQNIPKIDDFKRLISTFFEKVVICCKKNHFYVEMHRNKNDLGHRKILVFSIKKCQFPHTGCRLNFLKKIPGFFPAFPGFRQQFRAFKWSFLALPKAYCCFKSGWIKAKQPKHRQ